MDQIKVKRYNSICYNCRKAVEIDQQTQAETCINELQIRKK